MPQEETKKGYEGNTTRQLKVTFRVFQAIFFGVLALGISMILGDLTEAVKIPISSFSMGTTVFGALGAIITGILAEKCEDW